jgi:hypothetical protein
MVRMKNTQSKRGLQGEGLTTSTRKITRMEQVAREAKGTFFAQVNPKGKRPSTIGSEKSTPRTKAKHGRNSSKK